MAMDATSHELSESREFAERSGEITTIAAVTTAVLRERRFLLRACGVGALLGLGLGFFVSRTYTSMFAFVPQIMQDPSRAGIASLAGQFGVSLGGVSGGVQPPQFFADVLVSRDLLAPIAADSFVVSKAGPKVSLSELLGVRATDRDAEIERTVRALRDKVIKTNVAARTTGIVTVNVQTRHVRLSQEISERLLAGLNEFNISTRQSQATKERRFIETRLKETRQELREAEQRMETFLLANRVTASSPSLIFQQERLRRDVGMKQEVVSGLTQQYEDAKIREVRDTPVITIVDRPVPAAVPDPGRRLYFLILGFTLAFLAALAFVIGREAILRREASGTSSELEQLLGEIASIIPARFKTSR